MLRSVPVADPVAQVTDHRCAALEETFERQWRSAMADLIKRLLVSTPAYRSKWKRQQIRPSKILTARRFQRTVQLVEEHSIGPDRIPVRHRTRQVIEALVDGSDRHLFFHDARDATVSIERGGVLGRTFDLSPSLVGVEILYEVPLRAGEHRTLVYETCFNYAERPPPNFRRAALRQVEAMSLVVTFDAAAIPDRIWWCSWKSLELPSEERQEVPLREDLSVEQFVASAGGQIVGFEWRWDDEA